MAAFTVSLSYPRADGSYSEYEDITRDVIETSIGTLKQALEADEFNLGKITFGNITIILDNSTARYSEAINAASLFPYKRDESRIKVTWNRNNYPAACGNTACGLTFLSHDLDVFEGLLEDNSTAFDTDSQTIKYKVLSLDSIINKTDTPFNNLSVLDDAETTLYNILNQVGITKFFNVSASNISLSYNFTPDDISILENTKCLTAVQEILNLGNAVMFVKDSAIYIQPRNPDPISSFIFYGPSSRRGIENIHNISAYKTGINKCFNKWVWEDTDLVQEFQDSQSRYGLRQQELSSDLITDDGKRLAVLNAYLVEFGFPKTEMTITVPLTSETALLTFLNKINIDYPADVLPVKDSISARYGQARYGEARYARTVNSLFIAIEQEWKILNININTSAHTLTYKLREV